MSDKDKQPTPTPPPSPPPPLTTPTKEPTESEKAARALEGRVREAIKSLKFRTNKKIEVEGEPSRYVPDERPLKFSDVMSFADVGGKLVIVSADGRKHRLAA